VPTLLSWTGGRGQFRQMRGGRDRWSSGGPAEERQALAAFSSWLQQASGDLWSSGGPAEEKARNTAFPNAAMLSQTIIIFHGGVMPNWPRPPVQERSVGTSEDPTSWERSECLDRWSSGGPAEERHDGRGPNRVARLFETIALVCGGVMPNSLQMCPEILARMRRWDEFEFGFTPPQRERVRLYADAKLQLSLGRASSWNRHDRNPAFLRWSSAAPAACIRWRSDLRDLFRKS